MNKKTPHIKSENTSGCEGGLYHKGHEWQKEILIFPCITTFQSVGRVKRTLDVNVVMRFSELIWVFFN